MPVYIRRAGPMDIPEPSDHGGGEDDDDGDSFLRDPEQLRDQLPQPFRMIDKALSRLMDSAWETIMERETIRTAEQSKKKIPIVELSADFKLPVRTNCLTCSGDGRFIFMGHSQGVSVCSTSSLHGVSAWLDGRVEITSIHVTCLGEMAYLLGAVDDMGVARLFAYNAETIHLIKVINETEDINQRSVCLKFELSKGGDFGAIAIGCNGAHWLEVYRFPKESWLKELEMMPSASQKQTQHPSGAGDVKLSPIAMLMKIKPPKTQSGSTLKSPFEVLQKTENGTVIGSGQNHLISSRQWEDQDIVFKSYYRKYLLTSPSGTRDTEERTSHCTSHFLLPGGSLPVLGGIKPQPGVPIAVCVWWTGSQNLLQYLICKAPKDKPDTEPKPDVLWPNAHEILCSAVNSCTKYIALGLATGLVTVWDRHSGVPLPVVSVWADSAFSRMLFVDHDPTEEALLCQGQGPSTVQLLVTCQSGACHLLTTGPAMDSHATQLIQRAADAGSLPTVTSSVPFLHGVAFVMHKNGKIFLQDINSKNTVCTLTLPESHLLATPWDPVFALDTVQQTLFIRGDRRPNHIDLLEKGEEESCLFVCSLLDLAIVEPHRNALRASLTVKTGTSLSNLEEACNIYFQQRVLFVDERNKAMTQTWSQLQQHAMVLHSQQKHSSTTGH